MDAQYKSISDEPKFGDCERLLTEKSSASCVRRTPVSCRMFSTPGARLGLILHDGEVHSKEPFFEFADAGGFIGREFEAGDPACL